MGRFYVVSFIGVTVSAAQDLFELVAPTSAQSSLVLIHEWQIFQTSDVADAAEEILRIETVRGIGAVTSGSGGTSSTVTALDLGDPSYQGSCEVNNTTRMAGGAGGVVTLEQHGWNVRVPLQRIYPLEMRPVLVPGDRWTLSLPAAPADPLTMTGMLLLEDIR